MKNVNVLSSDELFDLITKNHISVSNNIANDDLLSYQSQQHEHILIVKTSWWTPEKVMVIGWMLKIALVIAAVVMCYGLKQYDHSLMEAARI